MRVHSNAARRTPTLYFTVDGVSSVEVSRTLAEDDVLVPAGSFYASMAFDRLGLTDTYGLRAGMAPYTDARDIDRLLDGLGSIIRR